MFDCAVDSRVVSEVTPDRRVDSDCTSASVTDCTVESELAMEAWVDACVARETWLDVAVEISVDTLTSSERSVETTLETEVAADRVAETDRPSEVPAEVIAEVETTLLITATADRNAEFSVESDVSVLATIDTPVEVELSTDTFWETSVVRIDVWLWADEAPLEVALAKPSADEMPVLRATVCESTLDTPMVAVDSEPDMLVKALRPDETCRLVGEAPSATIVEMADEKSTAREVVADRTVLSDVAPLSAVEATLETDVAEDRAFEDVPDRDVWMERLTLEEFEICVFSDEALEIWTVWEFCSEIRVDTPVDTETSALMTVETEPVRTRPAGSAPFITFVGGKASRSRIWGPSTPAMTTYPVIRIS